MVLPDKPASTIFFIEKSYKQTKKYIFTWVYPNSSKDQTIFIVSLQANRIVNEKTNKARRRLNSNKPKFPEAAWIKGPTCLGKVPSLPG